MDTDLKDPRGKIRCIQQAEEERKAQNGKKYLQRIYI